MNIRKLFTRLKEEGVDEVFIKLTCDEYEGVHLKEIEYQPTDPKEDEAIPADFVKEVLGTDNRGEMSMWELVEEAAILSADYLAGGWDNVEVYFNTADEEVSARGWSKNSFNVSRTVDELQ